MKITDKDVQRLISEELVKASRRRSRDGLSRPIFEGVDVNDLLTFAKAYRDMNEDLVESFDAAMRGDFEDVFVPLTEAKQALQNVHPEIDQAFADHASWMKTNG